MVSYLAVVFFCAGGDCFFWSSPKLQPNEATCQKDAIAVVQEVEKLKAKAYFQCLKVPLVGA